MRAVSAGVQTDWFDGAARPGADVVLLLILVLGLCSGALLVGAAEHALLARADAELREVAVDKLAERDARCRALAAVAKLRARVRAGAGRKDMRAGGGERAIREPGTAADPCAHSTRWLRQRVPDRPVQPRAASAAGASADRARTRTVRARSH